MLRAVDYLLIICAMMNVVSFVMYGYDKYRARKNLWRIRESVLLGVAWLMGGIGAWLGMQVFRHKTKHTAFRVCVPLAAVLQVMLIGFAVLRLAGIG